MLNNQENIFWPEWEIVRLIGQGSFGAVYEIQHDVFGEKESAALKVISIPQKQSDIKAMRNDGYDEASITSTLESQMKDIVAEYSIMRKMTGCANIVNCEQVKWYQHEDGYGWDVLIKMELLTPLPDALPLNLKEEDVIKVARDLCNALIQCKRFDIVHRDIKPQNIFVSQFGDYKLGDFGIAKTVEKTTGGTVIGTYKYMAPEVYNHKPYGSGADIYSLGLVLYWLLNERRMPFLPLPPAKVSPGMDSEARERRFSGEPLPEPAHGSKKLKRIVMKACAYDPKDRYTSAAEMLADLNDEPIPTPVIMPVSNTDNIDAKDGTATIMDPGTVDGRLPVMHDKVTSESSDIGIFGTVREETRKKETDQNGTVREEAKTLRAEHKEKNHNKKKPMLFGIIAGAIAFVVILALLMRGCGADTPATKPGETQIPGGTTVPTTTEANYEMALTPDEVSLFVDGTVQLQVSGIPEDAEISWKSSDKKAATVSETGEVTGVGIGEATITATWRDGWKSYSAETKVKVDGSGVTLNTYEIGEFFPGQTYILEAQTSPEGQTVTWTSSNEKVVTVADGVVTAVGAGEATITVSFGNYSESCTVTVTQPKLVMNKSSVSLYTGETAQVGVSTVPGNASYGWSSDNPSVATVSNGTITATGSGTTKIRVKMTLGGIKYENSLTVTVTQPDVKLSSTSVTMMPGESKILTPTVVPSGQKVTWSSSNSGVVTVGSDGRIKGVANGTATVTATITYAGKTYQATCAVTVAEPTLKLSSHTAVLEISGISAGRCMLTAESNFTGGKVSWSSSNPDVAIVTDDGIHGYVDAVSIGTATITATYTVGGKSVQASCDVTVKAAASQLQIVDFSYATEGTIDSFWVSGTISSNYELVRVENIGTASTKLLGTFGGDTTEPYVFPKGVYSVDASVLCSYFIDQYRDLWNLYKTLSKILSVDESVTMNLTITCYDASGYCESRTLTYVIHG